MGLDEEILDIEDFDAKSYSIASKNKRFLNYVIDYFGYMIFIIIIGILIVLIASDTKIEEAVLAEEASVMTTFIEYFIIFSTILFYYTIQEFLFKGKTVGKFITKTRAVTATNQQISFKNALTRSACRLIPFETFSFLGDSGWHDSISKTKVIDDVNWNNQTH